MLIDSLIPIFDRAPEARKLFEALDSRQSASFGVPPIGRSFVLACAFARDPRPMLVLVAGEEAADRIASGLTLYLGREKVVRYLPNQTKPWDEEDCGTAVLGKRAHALHALSNGEERIVVASSRELLRCMPPKGRMRIDPLVIRVNEEIDGIEFEQLAGALIELGYERCESAMEQGTFSIAGGTIDIFGSDADCPARIEFFGDEVDSIRKIIPSTGQTVSDIDALELYPAREFIVTARDIEFAERSLRRRGILTHEIQADLETIAEFGVHGSNRQYLPILFDGRSTLLDYKSADTLVVMLEPRSLYDDSSRYFDELKGSAKRAKARFDGLYVHPSELDFGENQSLTLLSLIRSKASIAEDLKMRHAESLRSEERFLSQARSLISKNYLIVLGISDRAVREDVELMLVDAHIPINEVLGGKRGFMPNVVNISDSTIPISLIIPKARLALLNVDDSTLGLSASSTSDTALLAASLPYKPGDYVVHIKYGVALFKEMDKQTVAGINRDYLVLEYAEGDKLYIPVEQIGKISKYVGAKGTEPTLTRLNTNEWARARKKASASAKKLAYDLVDLYVRRSSTQGFAYGPDNEMQREMEAMFPYEETTDQAKAIADVKADMESSKPMDRLICGDVGFGKTEVAIRAAFKAVQAGKQVMVLCPTTVLAQQHFASFHDRFDPFAIEVRVLSRFCTAKESREAVEGFAKGTVDVLIGTHRLLSKDVNPKDLGLIIVDEEQRFGVSHKEQMKNLREHIDVLTLTATPIPRTLQMSLGGIRDMSLINTPPSFRIPVEVHVGEIDEDVIGGAIRREMERHGQVYYVSNRISDIDDAIERVKSAAPEARICYAHGRMGERKLESIMEEFAAGLYDVLISTTIIESGLDNPHTNTLIIEDSHRLGLSQLYQLKGRVGRSHIQAYAYFLYPSEIPLTEEAVERLIAIKENQELGSGIRIAMRDLEIRGTGSLFGVEQSGNITAIGFEAFATLLSDYVLEAKGQRASAFNDIVIDLPFESLIPDDYVEDIVARVDIYRRLALSRKRSEIDSIAREMESNYGPMPSECRNLIDGKRLQLLALDYGITSISIIGGKVVLDPVELTLAQLQSLDSSRNTYIRKSKRLNFRPAEGSTTVIAELVEFLDRLNVIDEEG